MKNYTLYNGVKVPVIGYGTWQIPNQEAKEAVKKAIHEGFRHIDTAAIYGNEEGVGDGIIASNVKRSDLFLTTKVWNTDQGYESTIKAFELSLKKLKTDYLDLYLIHWPAVNIFDDHKKKNLETWRAMEYLYEQKKVRAIGVCNFFEHHLAYLIEHAKIKPMVNQIEINPGHPALELTKFSQSYDILVQGYSPMMKGKIFDIPDLKLIASHHQKTIPQIIIKWLLQRGINPLSKSVTESRMKENLDVFDFELSDYEMKQISSLGYLGRIGVHPDDARF